MKKTLENFEDKVVRFKIKSPYCGRITGIVKLKKDHIFFSGGIFHRSSLLHIYSGKLCQYEWPLHVIDMRTIKELSEEEQILWKLEHNM